MSAGREIGRRANPRKSSIDREGLRVARTALFCYIIQRDWRTGGAGGLTKLSWPDGESGSAGGGTAETGKSWPRVGRFCRGGDASATASCGTSGGGPCRDDSVLHEMPLITPGVVRARAGGCGARFSPPSPRPRLRSSRFASRRLF